MSAAFAGICGHGTARMTGSAPGPAKVATRMVLLRMGLFSAPNLIRHHWSRLRARSGQPSIVADARAVARVPSRHARECPWRPRSAGRGAMAGQLDFYFFYGSIHSYLSVMRIGALASAAGVAVRWQPFNLREILIGAEQYRVHEERREDELFLARRRATRAATTSRSPAGRHTRPIPISARCG